MSTRDSIVYVAGLHIYQEVLSEEICVEFEAIDWSNIARRVSGKYGAPIISRDELKQIHEDIGKFLNRSDAG